MIKGTGPDKPACLRLKLESHSCLCLNMFLKDWAVDPLVILATNSLVLPVP